MAQGASHKIDLSIDKGEDQELLAWLASFGSAAKGKDVWLCLLEHVLRGGSIPADAFVAGGEATGEREIVRLRYEPHFYPTLHTVWQRAKTRTRSRTVVAALRYAKAASDRGDIALPVDIITGLEPEELPGPPATRARHPAGANRATPSDRPTADDSENTPAGQGSADDGAGSSAGPPGRQQASAGGDGDSSAAESSGDPVGDGLDAALDDDLPGGDGRVSPAESNPAAQLLGSIAGIGEQ